MNNIKVKLKDIVTVKNGSTPSTSNPNFYDGEIIWITPKDLSNQNGRYVWKGERTITNDGLSSCSSTLLPKGTVLMSSRAPIGLLSIAATELCTNQGFKNFIPNKNVINSEFLYYYLKTKIHDIEKLGSGTTFKEVSKSSIENFELTIPQDINDQYKISNILSSLDSKIELNNRINAELEAMAKTIYDYWFVQFDFPDKNGKPYKSSGGKMVWNEELKREVPEGWEVKRLREFVDTGSGGTPLSTRKEFYEKGNIPWINSGEVNSSFIIEAKKFITEEGLTNSSAKIFPRGTILMAMYGATAGQVSLMDFDASTNQAICAILPNDKKIVPYLKFGLHQMYKYLLNLSSGSARDNLSQDKIRDLLFVIPEDKILVRFYEVASSNFNKILINLKENQQLASLRDWLLPMLMNGQVKVN
jgi:type I restriction enzyme S subunit